MSVNLNMDNVSTGFEPIPIGAYEVCVTQFEEITANSGTEGVSFTYVVQEGEYAGRKLFDTYWITEKALYRLKNALEAMGVNIPAGNFNLCADDVIGKYIFASVDVGTYTDSAGEDKTKNIVKGLTPYKSKR